MWTNGWQQWSGMAAAKKLACDMRSVTPLQWQPCRRTELLTPMSDVGPSMSGRIESTADMLLEKYEGSLEKLREAAGKDPRQEMKLIREFKGMGETGVNIFCREAQLHWEELFPFADERTLETLAHHGIHCSSAQEVADLVDNDRCVSCLGQTPILCGQYLFTTAAVVEYENATSQPFACQR